MPTKNPEIQYLRVRHTGETQGSLHLSDLNTEENAKESYKIPVYVPEEGHVDLPLNDQVLLSFNQGSIRRHIDEGRITGHVVSDDGAAEVWVSPDGDDQNPGTRNAPFASIQYAIDTLVERVGHLSPKKVNLLGGIYDIENPIINYTKNLDIIGVGSQVEGRLESALGAVPSSVAIEGGFGTVNFIDTNMTKNQTIQWLDAGGFGFNTDSNQYSYTGASLTNVNTSFEPLFNRRYFSSTTLKNVYVEGDIYVLGGHNGPEPGNMERVVFENVYSNSTFKFKNVARLGLIDTSGNSSSPSVLDHVVSLNISGNANPYSTSRIVFDDIDDQSIVISNKGDLSYPDTTRINSDSSKKMGGEIEVYDGDFIVMGVRFGQDISVFNGNNLDFTGVTVEGNVDFTGAGAVTWRGGSFYGTLTDPDDKLGAAEAGDYLNVEAP